MEHIIEWEHSRVSSVISCKKCGLLIYTYGKIEKIIRGNYVRVKSFTTDTSKLNMRNARCTISDSDYRMRELLK